MGRNLLMFVARNNVHLLIWLRGRRLELAWLPLVSAGRPGTDMAPCTGLTNPANAEGWLEEKRSLL
jgi:hypothetical protein